MAYLKYKAFLGGLIADLILLTTPIGDPKDITMNVLEHLRGGKYFAVEDTRTFKSLLKYFDISLKEKLIFSFHDQSNRRDLNKAIKILESGENLYFVSEAGSPVIADPAFPLIIESKKLNHQIKSYSGVCSIIKALEVSSVPPCPFSFHGFFPREKNKRMHSFNQMTEIGGTHIFFESPRRVKSLLEMVLSFEITSDLWPLQIAVCRELTKTYEEIILLNKNNIEEKLSTMTFLGEFILIFQYENKLKKKVSDQELRDLASTVLNNGVGKKHVSKLVARILNMSSKDIYNRLNK